MERTRWVAAFSASIVAIILIVNECRGQIYGPSMNYHVFGDTLTAQVRSIMRRQMTPQDREMDSQITYEIGDTGEVNAHASNVDGNRIIVVNTGMIAVIDFLATMQAAVTPSSRYDCGGAYVSYLGQTAMANSRRVLLHQPLSINSDPFSFMHSHDAICPQVTLQQMAAPYSIYDDVRNTGLTESTKWVLLHEFAHHKYGDVDTKVSNSEQQLREERADAFAFNSVSHLPESPIAALNLMALFCSLENLSTDDNGRNHPAAVKRMKAMVEASHVYLSSSDFQDRLKKAGPDAVASYRAMLKAIDQIPDEVPF